MNLVSCVMCVYGIWLYLLGKKNFVMWDYCLIGSILLNYYVNRYKFIEYKLLK